MKKRINFDALTLSVAFFALALFGCNVQKYQVKQLDKYAIYQPSEFLRLSNQLNPCFNGKAKSDTNIVFGKLDTSITWTTGIPLPEWHDHIIHTDTSLIQPIRIQTVRIKIPVYTTIHDTVPDTRKVNTLQDQVTQADLAKTKSTTQLSDEQQTAKTRLYWIIGLSVMIGLFVAYKIYGLFNGSAEASAIKKII